LKLLQNIAASYDEEASVLIGKALELGNSKVKFVVTSDYSVEKSEGHAQSSNSVSKKLSGKGTPESSAALSGAVPESDAQLEIETRLSRGDSLPPFKVVQTSDPSEVELLFPESDDKVYLLDFWSASNNDHIQSYNDLLTSHPEWEGRVQVIVVSIGITQKTTAEVVSSRG
jgi:hypothetical protein